MDKEPSSQETFSQIVLWIIPIVLVVGLFVTIAILSSIEQHRLSELHLEVSHLSDRIDRLELIRR